MPEVVLTGESLNGQNWGFPLLPHLRRCAPFFRAIMACIIEGTKLSDHILGSYYPGIWNLQQMIRFKKPASLEVQDGCIPLAPSPEK
jgi:hypothetical protein